MSPFKNILVVVDVEADAQPALMQALALARESHAAVTVAEVLDERPEELKMISTGSRSGTLQEAVVEERAASLEHLVQTMDTGRLQVQTRVVYGTAFIETIKAVIEQKHDLVLCTAAAREQKRRMLFGGTAMSLIRKCPCPVWVVKPEGGAPPGRILAAVNPFPSESVAMGLSEKIIEAAGSLSGLFEADLHVVHAWTFYYEKTLRNRLNIAPDEVDRIIRDIENTHRFGVDALIRKCQLSLPAGQLHFLRGRPSMLIPHAVETHQIDLLVMGSVARAGVPGLLIGNTAEKILQKVDGAVLTLKPEGFVSPVKAPAA